VSGALEKARKHILGYLIANRLKPGNAIPSIRSIANELSVSSLTVQRAVAGLVRDGVLRTRVGSGTFVAQCPPTSPQVIGVIMPSYDSGDRTVFQTDIVRGTESVLNRCGYRGTIVQVREGNPVDEEASVVNDILSYGVHGLIVNLISPHDYPVWNKLAACAIPVVCVNNFGPKHLFSGVVTNNYLGGRLAAEHLRTLGRRNIMVLANNIKSVSIIERLDGFREYLSADKSFDQGNLSFLRHEIGWIPDDQIKNWIDHVCAMSPRPDALFIVNDDIAVRMMTGIKQRGIAVPSELSIIGFDDNEICRYSHPPLTTVRQPAFEIGRRAAELLMTALENGRTREITNLLLEPELVVRDSTAPVKA
jgi:LacI family transcriptional regulator